jgi:predicted transcriptional regulator
MEVHLKPETESRLNELASQSGRPTDELVEDAMIGYLAEVAEVRDLLDARYEDRKSTRVQPVDDETFFEDLRECEEKSLNQRPPK